MQKDNGVNFTRQALPVSGADTITVPVGIDSEKGGEVTFSAITVPLGNMKFWLEDRLTGTFTDLGAGSYTVTLPAKTYGTGRFFLKSAGSITGIQTPAEDLNRRQYASGYPDKVIIKGVVSEGARARCMTSGAIRFWRPCFTDETLNTVTLPPGSHGVYFVRVADGGKFILRRWCSGSCHGRRIMFKDKCRQSRPLAGIRITPPDFRRGNFSINEVLYFH